MYLLSRHSLVPRKADAGRGVGAAPAAPGMGAAGAGLAPGAGGTGAGLAPGADGAAGAGTAGAGAAGAAGAERTGGFAAELAVEVPPLLSVLSCGETNDRRDFRNGDMKTRLFFISVDAWCNFRILQ